MSADSVFTLADLDPWSFDGTALAVVGHPVKHSISPAMHNAALAELAKKESRFSTWRYFKFEIDPITLPLALRQFHEKQFFGLNLTVPHKVIAVPHVAQINPAAEAAGAVNTLLWAPGGYVGYNTDGAGLEAAVHEAFGRSLADTPVILLGAGGAARGAAAECLARGCAGLWIANRSKGNLGTLLDSLAPLAGRVRLHGFDPARPPADLPEALVINATSAGMRRDDPAPIDLAQLPRPLGVSDMIYNPPATPLLAHPPPLPLPPPNTP